MELGGLGRYQIGHGPERRCRVAVFVSQHGFRQGFRVSAGLQKVAQNNRFIGYDRVRVRSGFWTMHENLAHRMARFG